MTDNHIRLCKFCYRRETSQPSGSPKNSPIAMPGTPSHAPESSPRSEDEAIDEERNVRENNHSWSIFKENNQSRISVSDIVWAPKGSPTHERASGSPVTEWIKPTASNDDLKLATPPVHMGSVPSSPDVSSSDAERREEDEFFNLPRSTRHTSAVASLMSIFEGNNAPAPQFVQRTLSLSRVEEEPSYQTFSWDEMKYEEQLQFRADQHLIKLVGHLISSFKLPEEWKSELLELAKSATALLATTAGSNPLKHVEVYTVPGGTISQSHCINGVVLRNRVAHKRMRSQCSWPRLMLFECSLEFERTQGTLSELTTLASQEEQYIQQMVEVIVNMKPDVILCQGSLSRLALDLFLRERITVIANVPRRALRRMGRISGSTVLKSVRELSVLPAEPHLLQTLTPFARFRTTSFDLDDGEQEYFTVFEDSENKFGCCVLLRGGTPEEMKAAERILLFTIFVNYNLVLETTYLVEEGATSQILEKMIASLPNNNSSVSTLSQSVNALENFFVQQTHVEPLPPKADELSKPGEQALAQMRFDHGIDKECVESFRSMQEDFEANRTTRRALQLLSSSPNNWFAPQRDISDHPILKRWPTVCIPGSFLVPNFIDNSFTTSYMVTKQRANYNYPSTFVFKDVEQPSPLNQQSIQYLHTLCCRETGKQCIPYAIHKIDYYSSETDLPMIRFLRDYCFVKKKRCSVEECSYPLMSHDRSFLHGRGRLNITLEEASEFLESIEKNEIICWSSCPQCQLTTPFTKMSSAALDYSFGKWLEHSFYFQGNAHVANCTHSITREHIRYFMYQGIVAAISYESIPFYQLHLPPMKILYLPESRQKVFEAQQELIAATMHCLLHSTEVQIEELGEILKKDDDIQALDDIRLPLKEDKATMNKRFELAKELCKDDESALNEFKKNLLIHAWSSNRAFQALYQKSRTTTVTRRAMLSLAQAQKMQVDPIFVMYAVTQKRRKPLLATPTHGTDFEMPRVGAHRPLTSSVTDQRYRTQQIESNPTINNSHGALYKTIHRSSSSVATRRERNITLGEIRHERSVDDFHPRLATSIPNETGPHSDIIPEVPFTLNETTSGEDEEDLFEDGPPQPLHRDERTNSVVSVQSAGSEAMPALDMNLCTEFRQMFGEEETAWDENWEPAFDSDIEYPCLGKSPRNANATKANSSLLDALTGILPNLPTGVSPSTLSHAALQDTSGLFLREGVDNSVIVVSEKEPSSVIAHALSSEDYHQFLDAKQQEVMQQSVSSELDDEYVPLLSDLPTNCEISMAPSSSESKLRYSVIIYHAVQFRALRNLCVDEKIFIHSISHSKMWDATGGKSGSSWEKTLDGRFVIKRLPKVESDAFISMAPLYFKYLAKAYAYQVPTMLAKILGVFTIKLVSANKTIRQEVIVMENLFYNRNITRTYDLKGSLRNRLINVNETATSSVLLDENLLNDMFQYPLCVDEHSKALITFAVWNDSLFLSSLYVMDYSLIVGIDEENQELVVGIIDYIRQYTLDKQIEKWVKSQQGTQLPTVIAPKDYKERFRTAMWNYFVMVPSKFTTISNPLRPSVDPSSWEAVLKKYDADRAHSLRQRIRRHN